MAGEKGNKSVTKGTFKSLVPTQVKWEEVGTEVIGRLMHKETTMYRDQERGRYLISTSDGLKVVLGTYQIDQALVLVDAGETIRIKYLGEEGTNAGNKFKLFEIEVFEGESLDVDSGELAETAAS